MTSSKLSLIVFGGALAVLLSACTPATNSPVNTTVNTANSVMANGTNVASSNTANSIDPCSLITQAEAASAFGLPAQIPEPKGTVCRYDTVEQSKFFDLTAKAGTSSDFETMQNLCSTTELVDGLGATSCSANNTIVVLKNGILMTIIAGGNFDQDQLRGLAVIAVGRIP